MSGEGGLGPPPIANFNDVALRNAKEIYFALNFNEFQPSNPVGTLKVNNERNLRSL
jgi:hypothetical protein